MSKVFLINFAVILLSVNKVSTLTCFVSNYKNVAWNESNHNLEYKVNDCKSSSLREQVTYIMGKVDSDDTVENTAFACFSLRVKITPTNIVELSGCVPKFKCNILKKNILDEQVGVPQFDYISCDECSENRCNKPTQGYAYRIVSSWASSSRIRLDWILAILIILYHLIINKLV